jgi:hypothetical protein
MRQLGSFRRIPRFLITDPSSAVRLPVPAKEPDVGDGPVAGREPEGVRS